MKAACEAIPGAGSIGKANEQTTKASGAFVYFTLLLLAAQLSLGNWGHRFIIHHLPFLTNPSPF